MASGGARARIVPASRYRLLRKAGDRLSFGFDNGVRRGKPPARREYPQRAAQ
ncbi:MAG: hypothetical protein OHK0044_32950 [Burkholderiaceae bacterium]